MRRVTPSSALERGGAIISVGPAAPLCWETGLVGPVAQHAVVVFADGVLEALDGLFRQVEVVGSPVEDLDGRLELLGHHVARAQSVERLHLGEEAGAGDDVEGRVHAPELGDDAAGSDRIADDHCRRPGALSARPGPILPRWSRRRSASVRCARPPRARSGGSSR